MPAYILLVEDHLDTLQVLRAYLQRRGHEVVAASNCDEAIRFAQEKPVDVLITDLQLPDCDGATLLKRLRASGPTRGIVLTGNDNPEEMERTRSAGFDFHLTKPLDPQALRNAVEECIAIARNVAEGSAASS